MPDTVQDESFFELWSYVGWLGERLRGRFGLSRATLRAFAAHEDECRPDDAEPTRETLLACIAAFNAEPLAVQREVLGGWRPCPRRLTNAELRRAESGTRTPCRVIRVEPELAVFGSYIAQDWTLDELGQQLTVVIQEGTTLDEALRLLDLARRTITKRFADVVEQLPRLPVALRDREHTTNEKSGVDQPPIVLTPASKRNEKATPSTAA